MSELRVWCLITILLGFSLGSFLIANNSSSEKIWVRELYGDNFLGIGWAFLLLSFLFYAMVIGGWNFDK